MKTLGKFLGNGAYKNAYEIEGFPKQVALVLREDPAGWGHAWALDEARVWKYFKGEHKSLSKLRKAGIPAMKARIMRVYNPHLKKESWALIVTRMKGSLHHLGVGSLTMQQWKSYLHTLRQLAKTKFDVTDIQFLVDDKKVVINDPGTVYEEGRSQEYWIRYLKVAEQDFKYLNPGKELPV